MEIIFFPEIIKLNIGHLLKLFAVSFKTQSINDLKQFKPYFTKCCNIMISMMIWWYFKNKTINQNKIVLQSIFLIFNTYIFFSIIALVSFSFGFYLIKFHLTDFLLLIFFLIFFCMSMIWISHPFSCLTFWFRFSTISFWDDDFQWYFLSQELFNNGWRMKRQ